jgi:ABC-type transport system substrate-binding protein
VGSAQAPVEAIHDWGVGDCLFGSDATSFEVPMIATGYELADDLSYVDIHIRSGVMFQGGFGEETAEDWVYTFNDGNAYTNPESIHGQAGDFAALFLEAELIDKYTFRLPFKTYDLRWVSNFLNDAAQSTNCFSKKVLDEKGEDWMMDNIIADGPFQVTEWVRDDHVYLEKRPDGHWRQEAKLDKLTFLEVPEESTRIAMLKTGEIDIIRVTTKAVKPLMDAGFAAVSPEQRYTVNNLMFHGNYWETNSALTGEPLKREGYCAHDLPWVGCTLGCPGEGTVDIDGNSSQCKDPGDMEEARNIRWALALAIDRELINEAVLDGLGAPASIEYVDTQMAYYKDKWDIPYDPALAKEYMSKADAAAWQNGEFHIDIWTGDEGGTALVGEITDAISGFWRAAWPKMDVAVFKSAYAIIRPSLVGRTNVIPYAGDGDEGASTIPFDFPHGMTETSITRGGFGCGLEIPKLAETCLKVRKETDINERLRLNEEVIDYMHDQMLMVGTVQIPSLMVYNPKSIKEWVGYPCFFGGQGVNYEAIVPAD